MQQSQLFNCHVEIENVKFVILHFFNYKLFSPSKSLVSTGLMTIGRRSRIKIVMSLPIMGAVHQEAGPGLVWSGKICNEIER